MTVTELPLMVPASWVEEAFGDDDETHIYCCRPNRALCGIDMDESFEDVDEDEAEDCVACWYVAQADVPCGAPLCRARRAWRKRRWSR